MKRVLSIISAVILFSCGTNHATTENTIKEELKTIDAIEQIKVGAEQIDEYLHLLKGKKVGVVANHTTMIGDIHLVDTLMALGIDVKKVFAPEHGFRGKADAGAHVADGKDAKTGLPIVSLYGSNKKPKPEQVKDLDVLLFDIQDVGTRFYTYISTMHYVMEACAENDKECIVFDRPNPNGHYVAGPVRDRDQKSFVGMHAIPIVHGLTVGELANMINGEKWLEGERSCKLTVVENKNYSHGMEYILPIKPSPNLPNIGSIYLYPTLCLFEGTVMSVGRGTHKQFQILGHPSVGNGNYSFTPEPLPGAMKPKLEGKLCNGWDYSKSAYKVAMDGEIVLDWLISNYQNYPEKEKFFTSSFDRLAGTTTLKQDIKEGKSGEEIIQSWQQGLDAYKVLRQKYLLYPEIPFLIK